MSDAAWTDERTEHLKEMHATGLSASHMAARLGGISRNAVCGKVHRLGLPGRPRSGRLTGTPRMPRARRPYVRKTTAAEPITAPMVAPAPPKCDPIEFMALNNVTCRFPIGEVIPYLFCGSPEADLTGGVSYCPWHMRQAHDRRGAMDITDEERGRRRGQARKNNVEQYRAGVPKFDPLTLE